MDKKSIEDLQKEREALQAEIDELKKSKDQLSSDDGRKALEDENQQLRELVENYKADVEAANKFAQQVMLEYGARSKDEKNENETPDKTEEELAIEDANKALEDYINSKGEKENEK